MGGSQTVNVGQDGGGMRRVGGSTVFVLTEAVGLPCVLHDPIDGKKLKKKKNKMKNKNKVTEELNKPEGPLASFRLFPSVFQLTVQTARG